MNLDEAISHLNRLEKGSILEEAVNVLKSQLVSVAGAPSIEDGLKMLDRITELESANADLAVTAAKVPALELEIEELKKAK